MANILEIEAAAVHAAYRLQVLDEELAKLGEAFRALPQGEQRAIERAICDEVDGITQGPLTATSLRTAHDEDDPPHRGHVFNPEMAGRE